MNALLAPARTLLALARAVITFDRFTRIHFVGYSSLWPLLGAATADAAQPLAFWLGIAALGVAFHFFGGVLNDVVDLPVDRTQPARAADPLVRGTVTRAQALAFALGQLPIGLALVLGLGGGLAAAAWLAAAFAAMAVYDLFGKRCAVPPLTDAAQGVAWLCLTLCGASLAGAAPSRATLAVAASGLVYTLLINGVHGGMRDLGNDFAAGARTTALWLGMRPGPRGEISVPARAAWFCGPLVAALLALAALAQPTGGSGVAAAAAALAGAAVIVGMQRVLQPERAGWQAIFRLHLVGLLVPLLCIVLPQLPVPLALGIAAFFLAPMALLEFPRRALARGASPDDELLIAVDEHDRPLGPIPRAECHAGAGILHRAFSVYLFDAAGRVLLQRRSEGKRLWPMFWSNSCCSHPRWGEAIDAAAHRRVREELGVEVALRRVFAFVYHAAFGAAGSERELCAVYVGRLAEPVRRNEREIAELRYASAEEVDRAVATQPEAYTPWFRLGWERLRRDHWREVEAR